MVKRVLSPSVAASLREVLHVAVLDALVASRRWAPGELVFQGGTALHLVHGSPRFSEDLDFLVSSSIDLKSIEVGVKARLAQAAFIPRDAGLVVSKARDGRNPHAFDVCLSGKQLIGSVRVKVELWQTAASTLASLRVEVRPVRDLSSGLQTFVPAAATHEIHADKVFALAARPYLKPRDIFDLHWLRSHDATLHCGVEDMTTRFATYPNTTLAEWLAAAADRRQQMQDSVVAIARDLSRWLPSILPMTGQQVKPMVACCEQALADAIGLYAAKPRRRLQPR